jgi:hypothetical protein
MVDAPAAAQAPAPLPLFYKQPRPLDANTHKASRLKDNASFGFARRANSVPINGVEFAVAQRHYPIVFTGTGKPFPAAVMGLRVDENLFVGDDGRWVEGIYVPAYVRRYPFVFIEAPEDKLILAIDEGSGLLVDEGPHKLFDEAGKPTPLVNGALQFCGAYQANFKQSLEFIDALVTQDLLVDNRANAVLANGERLTLGGFKVIDEEKFKAVPAAVLESWRDQGWLAWIYAHFFSLTGWNGLAALASKRPPAVEVATRRG